MGGCAVALRRLGQCSSEDARFPKITKRHLSAKLRLRRAPNSAIKELKQQRPNYICSFTSIRHDMINLNKVVFRSFDHRHFTDIVSFNQVLIFIGPFGRGPSLLEQSISAASFAGSRLEVGCKWVFALSLWACVAGRERYMGQLCQREPSAFPESV